MLYETSKLHPYHGITYREQDLYQVIDKSPRAKGSEQPLPEAMFWLLLTGEYPTEKEVEEF